ncbi:RMV1 [Symbiodinium microadriaticum]|nr:RMV1 [Symbiodinium microadriaticum]
MDASMYVRGSHSPGLRMDGFEAIPEKAFAGKAMSSRRSTDISCLWSSWHPRASARKPNFEEDEWRRFRCALQGTGQIAWDNAWAEKDVECGLKSRPRQQAGSTLQWPKVLLRRSARTLQRSFGRVALAWAKATEDI